MIEGRFSHVNVVARDWRALAAFYQDVLGCVFVPPERDFSGPAVTSGTGVPNAAFRGAHLRLPGHGDGGPTLEIFEYDDELEGGPAAANRRGFGHVAFGVPDVPTARRIVLENGGHPIGDIVTVQTSDGRKVTWTYVTDPEGNIIELQAWSDPAVAQPVTG